MNNDLISRSALRKALEVTQYNDIDDLTRTERLIDNAPTVTIKEWKKEMPIYIKDAMLEALRPQGEWIKISPANIYECSKCHQVVMTSDIKCYLYCHQCGTEMRVKHELNNELNELNHEKEHKERIFNPFDHRTIGEI